MKSIIGLCTLLLSQIAFAGPQAAPVVQTWTNPECASGSCEVKGMKLSVTKYNANRMAGNNVSVEIETATKELVKKYAVVQYIKGCLYEILHTGEIKMGTREFFNNKGVPFLHKTFEIDSAKDRDPIYSSNPDAGWDELRGFDVPRNSYYANGDLTKDDTATMWAGKIKNLRGTKVYVADAPSVSNFDLDLNNKPIIQNSSLTFKVCLHEVSKVPRVAQSPTSIVPDPITCMEWSSNYLYDKAKHRFVEKKEISPVCL